MEVWELERYFHPSAGGLRKKKKKRWKKVTAARVTIDSLQWCDVVKMTVVGEDDKWLVKMTVTGEDDK